MPVKVRFSADALIDLRLYLRGADFDFGCRPAVRRDGSRYYAEAMTEQLELDRFRSARAGPPGVRVDIVEEVASRARTSEGLVGGGNRFATTAVVSGLGTKE